MLTLSDLFPDAAPGIGSRFVTGLAFDSRKVLEGSAFVAVPGAKADGSAFVADAVSRGAGAIVGEAERPSDLPERVAYLRVPNARRALSLAASRLHPGQPGSVVAVTGTSGKSSVAEFTRQLLAAIGHDSASLGTLGVIKRDGAAYGSLTTPDPITLHATLNELAREGVAHLAMEASSHGLDQFRLDGVRLAAAGFTNLGRDHLDYHPSVEEYLRAKLRLFTELLPKGAPAVVNADGAEATRVMDACRERGLDLRTTGRSGDAVRLLASRRDGFSQHLSVQVDGRQIETLLPLVGDFQVENALVAAGLAMAVTTGQEREIVAAFPILTGVPGRLERVGEVNGALVLVDYAHKPDALAAVLATLRPFATGRLVCVFGCGGDRDRGKRPIMGAIASEGADLVIVTDDNPRSEDPAAIRRAVLDAVPGAREIGDRAEAIRAAVRGLGPGDVLVVAGKGHETGQIVGDRTLPFSDQDCVRAAIAEMGA